MTYLEIILFGLVFNLIVQFFVLLCLFIAGSFTAFAAPTEFIFQNQKIKMEFERIKSKMTKEDKAHLKMVEIAPLFIPYAMVIKAASIFLRLVRNDFSIIKSYASRVQEIKDTYNIE